MPLKTSSRLGLPSAVRGIGPAGGRAGATLGAPPPRPPPPPRPCARAGVETTATPARSTAIDSTTEARFCITLLTLLLDIEVSRKRVMNAEVVEHRRALVVEQADLFLALQHHADRPRARK